MIGADLSLQYNQHPYPLAIEDLDDYAKQGGYDFSDPSRIRQQLWPKNVAPHRLSILVAGCGSNQAAIIAQANRHCDVVGIDISRAAICHHHFLKKKHALENLCLLETSIEQADELGLSFDLIICSGVLHHLESPEIGLAVLTRVLKPHGVMSLMVYGRHLRHGLEMVQRALRQLKTAGQTSGDISLAREAIASLPSWHSARPYLELAPDIHYDAGIVDSLLNLRERSYDVPQIMDFLCGAGLQFQSWLQGVNYSPSAVFPAGSQILDRIEILPKTEQWNVVDLLSQTVGAHRFLACHQNRNQHDITPDFSGDQTEWPEYLTSLHPDVRINRGSSTDAVIQKDWHSFPLTDQLVRVLLSSDGKTSLRDIGLKERINLEDILPILDLLHEWGYLLVEIPDTKTTQKK